MKVLVAEDDTASRELMAALMEKEGYDVIAVEDGEEAWKVLRDQEAPKLVILDWLMPGLDGLEVCRKIRAEKRQNYTYIIMVTVKDDRDDIQAGFDAGADDYLTKPLDVTQLKHRLRSAKRITRYEEQLEENRRELDRYAAQMKQLAEERAEQLVRADRMATLGTLSAGIAHEINNPASFISGNAQSLEKAWETVQKALEDQASDGEESRLDFVLEEVPEMIAGIKKGVRRISKIVDGLKSYVRSDTQARGEKSAIDLHGAIEHALQLCHNELKYNIDVSVNVPDDGCSVVGNRREIEQVLVNLITNAAHAMSEVKNGKLHIAAERNDGRISVSVEDNGPGIPEEDMRHIFDPFFTTKTGGKGTGLGLSISQGIIKDHGGELTASNRPQKGASFTFSLPEKEGKDSNEGTTADC
ncbi:MAG: sensor histidine kinase [Planctomycetota bacterium]